MMSKSHVTTEKLEVICNLLIKIKATNKYNLSITFIHILVYFNCCYQHFHTLICFNIS